MRLMGSLSLMEVAGLVASFQLPVRELLAIGQLATGNW
jgi:hypothetical protein